MIGGDDEDDDESAAASKAPNWPQGSNVEQTADNEENNTMQNMNSAPAREMIKIETIKRDPIYIAEKNRSKIDSFTASGDVYQAFEAGIPLQLIDYREYEGRVKKLVFGRATISIRQL